MWSDLCGLLLGCWGEGCFAGFPGYPGPWVPFTAVWLVSQPGSWHWLGNQGWSSFWYLGEVRASLDFEFLLHTKSYLLLPSLPFLPSLSLLFGPWKRTHLSWQPLTGSLGQVVSRAMRAEADKSANAVLTFHRTDPGTPLSWSSPNTQSVLSLLRLLSSCARCKPIFKNQILCFLDLFDGVIDPWCNDCLLGGGFSALLLLPCCCVSLGSWSVVHPNASGALAV